MDQVNSNDILMPPNPNNTRYITSDNILTISNSHNHNEGSGARVLKEWIVGYL